MPWYDEHVAYGDDVLRPYLKDSGMEVHQVQKKLEQGHLPQQIIRDFNDVHELLGEVEGSDAPLDVEDSAGFENSKLDAGEVEAALAFEEEYPEMIQQIIREDNALQEAQMLPPEEAYERVNELDLEYYSVEATFTEQDGEPVVEFEYSQP